MKKGFTLIELIAVVAILGLIAIIVYPAIGTVIRNARENTYESQIDVIESAAENWSVDNANTLSDDGSIYRLPVTTLLNEGYITDDEVKDPRDSSKTLNGEVEIKYDSTIKQFTYKYTETASSISANTLSETIINNSKNKAVLLASDGLYKGANPDNYLKIDDIIWRIISINEDGSIKIVADEESAKIAYDINGTNTFDTSSIKTYLNETFYQNLNNISEFKTSLFCAQYTNGICEKKQTLTVGLLTLEDYFNASNNLKCQTGTERECLNGNYLTDYSKENGAEYMLNTVEDKVYIINDGLISESNATENLNVRPVISVTASAKIIDGMGSKENPYVLSIA